MNASVHSPVRSLRLFEPEPGVVYPIEAASHLTHVPRRAILVYCKHGVVAPIVDPAEGGYYFDHDALRALQRADWLHSVHGVNFAGTRMILDLMSEVEHLRARLRTQEELEESDTWHDLGRL